MPILQKLITAFRLWRSYWIHFDKLTKFGLGIKIESLFIEIIQNIFTASYKSSRTKLEYLNKASDLLDTLKFLLQILWEIKSLETKKYVVLSSPLEEAGRMLGGWQKKQESRIGILE